MKRTKKFSDLEKGQDVTLFLRNGEVVRGIFQFIDGDEFDGEVVLKAIGNDKTPMLGWNIKWISNFKIN